MTPEPTADAPAYTYGLMIHNNGEWTWAACTCGYIGPAHNDGTSTTADPDQRTALAAAAMDAATADGAAHMATHPTVEPPE